MVEALLAECRQLQPQTTQTMTICLWQPESKQCRESFQTQAASRLVEAHMHVRLRYIKSLAKASSFWTEHDYETFWLTRWCTAGGISSPCKVSAVQCRPIVSRALAGCSSVLAAAACADVPGSSQRCALSSNTVRCRCSACQLAQQTEDQATCLSEAGAATAVRSVPRCTCTTQQPCCISTCHGPREPASDPHVFACSSSSSTAA
jgi:hypothetical protein